MTPNTPQPTPTWYLPLTDNERATWATRGHADYKYIVTVNQYYAWLDAPNLPHIVIPNEGEVDNDFEHNSICLVLYIGFCFDGPSGPMRDTPSAMLAAAFHDFLYRCNRNGQLVSRPAPQTYLAALRDPVRWSADTLFGTIAHRYASNHTVWLRGLRHFRAVYSTFGIHVGAAHAWRTR